MSDWRQPPEFASDEIPMVIYDRKALDVAVGGHRKAPKPPPGFVPEHLKGDMNMQRMRGKVRRGSSLREAKNAEMAEREALLREGKLTRREIADRFGIDPSSVRQQAAKLGIPQVVPDRRPRPEMEARERLIRAGELSYGEIARRYGVHRDTIWSQAKKMGIPPRRVKTDGRTRTGAEAAGRQDPRGQSEQGEARRGDEATSEAAA